MLPEIVTPNEIPWPGTEIGIATTTFYPGWSSRGTRPDTDQIRGDLAIEMLSSTVSKGFRVAIVDGGSSTEFIATLRNMQVDVSRQQENGMSDSRRQVLKEAAATGSKVVCWVEPEKVSIIRDSLPDAARPILEGRAEIVIPARDRTAFKAYPIYQANYEQRANCLWNKILRAHGFEVAQDLDVWFGPRFIKNDPKLLELFQRKYSYVRAPVYGGRQSQVDDLELYPNATFLPIINAIHEGYRVVSVPISYRHPEAQTANEIDSEEFRKKRELQFQNVIAATIHLIRLLEKNPKGRIRGYSY